MAVQPVQQLQRVNFRWSELGSIKLWMPSSRATEIVESRQKKAQKDHPETTGTKSRIGEAMIKIWPELHSSCTKHASHNASAMKLDTMLCRLDRKPRQTRTTVRMDNINGHTWASTGYKQAGWMLGGKLDRFCTGEVMYVHTWVSGHWSGNEDGPWCSIICPL